MVQLRWPELSLKLSPAASCSNEARSSDGGLCGRLRPPAPHGWSVAAQPGVGSAVLEAHSPYVPTIWEVEERSCAAAYSGSTGSSSLWRTQGGALGASGGLLRSSGGGSSTGGSPSAAGGGWGQTRQYSGGAGLQSPSGAAAAVEAPAPPAPAPAPPPWLGTVARKGRRKGSKAADPEVMRELLRQAEEADGSIGGGSPRSPEASRPPGRLATSCLAALQGEPGARSRAAPAELWAGARRKRVRHSTAAGPMTLPAPGAGQHRQPGAARIQHRSL